MLVNHWGAIAARSPGALAARKHRWVAVVKSAIRCRLELDESVEVRTDDLG